MEDISDEDYIHAQKLFEEFKVKNICEYHDLYLKNDVLLSMMLLMLNSTMNDVFENFRETCLDIFELDPPKLIQHSD